ncbi:hypothetical protein V8E36_001538 [Tilletia maclaganii]
MSRRSNSSGSTAFSSARASLGPGSGAAPASSSLSGAVGSSSGSSGGGGGGAIGASTTGSGAALGGGLNAVEAIVIDLGVHTVKIGFAGEPRPRAILPTALHSQPSSFLVAHPNPASWQASGYGHPEVSAGLPHTDRAASPSASASNPAGPALWDLDFNRCKNERVRKEKTEYLLARLTNLLRKVFNQYLMCDPKARRVIVVENPLTPTVVKECIYTVLFKRLHVPAVTPLPSPFLALVALGLPTGLLLSLGHLEASITPLFHGAPISSSKTHPASLQLSLSSVRASGARLTRRLRALLIAYGQIITSPPPNPGTGRGLAAVASAMRGSARHSILFAPGNLPGAPTKSRVDKVSAADLDALGSDFLEQVKVKALIISEPMVESVESLASTLGSLSFRTDTAASASAPGGSDEQAAGRPAPKGLEAGFQWHVPPSSQSPYDSPLDSNPEFLQALKTRYQQHTKSTPNDTQHSSASQSRPSPPTQSLSFVLPHVINNIPSVNRVPGLTTTGTSAAANVLASSTTPSQHRVLVVPAWIRERCAEILFEARTDSVLRAAGGGEKAGLKKEEEDGEEEEDECSLTELVLRALQEVPLPLRRHFASRIAVAGGTAQLQGLAHRLRVEVMRSLEALERITHFSDVHGDSTTRRSPRSSSDLPSPQATAKPLGDDAGRGASPAVPRSSDITGLNTSTSRKGRLRRTDAESSLLAGVPLLHTHELPLSWRRRYAQIGTLWRYVRVVNDHQPPNAGSSASGERRTIPVSVGVVLDPEERLAGGAGGEMLSPHAPLDAVAARRRRRRSGTVQAEESAKSGAYSPALTAGGVVAEDAETAADPSERQPYVPMYKETEQQALRKAHEHDVRYNLLNPKDTDRSKPYAGQAPTLAPSLLPWIGGSLVGSLRTATAAPLIPLVPGMNGSAAAAGDADGTRAARSPVKAFSASAAAGGGAQPRKSHAGVGASSRHTPHKGGAASTSTTSAAGVESVYANPVRRALHLNHPALPDAPDTPTYAHPTLGQSVFLPHPTVLPGTITREQFIEDDTVRRRCGLASFGPQSGGLGGGGTHGAGIDAEAAALLGGKGSFVGVVGGLDTGAYGGLAAVSRHMRGAWGAGAGAGASAGAGGGLTSPRKE